VLLANSTNFLAIITASLLGALCHRSLNSSEKEWSINDDAWYYGEDGAAALLLVDFAWFKFEIHFDKEDKVVKKLFNINYD
jgi:hypothetical protein